MSDTSAHIICFVQMNLCLHSQ